MDTSTALTLTTEVARRRMEVGSNGYQSTDYSTALLSFIEENHDLLRAFVMGYNSPIVIQLARETLNASATLAGHYETYDCVKGEEETCDCEDCRQDELAYVRSVISDINSYLGIPYEECGCACADCEPEPLPETIPHWLQQITSTAAWDADFSASLGNVDTQPMALKVVTDAARAFAERADAEPDNPYLIQLEDEVAAAEEALRELGL